MRRTANSARKLTPHTSGYGFPVAEHGMECRSGLLEEQFLWYNACDLLLNLAEEFAKA